MGSLIRDVCTQIPTKIILIFVNIEHYGGGTLNVPCTKLINSRRTSIIRLSKKQKNMKAVLK